MNFNNNDNSRLITTFFILFIILFTTDYFFGQYKNNHSNTNNNIKSVQSESQKRSGLKVNTDNRQENNVALTDTKKNKNSYLEIQNSSIIVKVNTGGGIIESVKLKRYNDVAELKENTKPQAVELLSGTDKPYYVSVVYNWENFICNEKTEWKVSENKTNVLELDTSGINCKRTFLLDQNRINCNNENDDYTITIVDELTNTTKKPLKLNKSIGIFRKNPKIYNYAVVHEGAIVNTEHKVREIKYDKIKNGEQLTNSQWFGFTDKYWLCAVLNENSNSAVSLLSNVKSYKLSTSEEEFIVNPGQTYKLLYTVFVGPKDINVLNKYAEKLNIDKFERAIDFGWFFMITKPLTQFMGWLSSIIPNMGIVILLLTLLFRFLTYPLMKKSFISIAKMKTIQPQIARLQKVYANDKLRLNQELVAIYRREHISPLSGCLPMLLQAPIFFCLYKVFFISISMRHAPLFGWIYDLSAPDTCYITNLFGLINWTPPGFLQIGIWPLIMGTTMLIQQKISSAMSQSNNTISDTPEQKAQRKMMYFMPIFFTYISISFPVSIIVYWTVSNIIGIIQQQYVTNKINKS